MANVEDLVIHFNYGEGNQKQFYLPGETIHGTAVLHLRGSLRVHNITMYIQGTGSVNWEVPKKKKTYIAKEIYVESSKLLLDSGFGGTINLGRGAHEFAFDYELPNDIPSSFQGVYGSVIYLLKVVVEPEDERQSTISSEPFLVLRRPPLPESLYKETKLKKSKTFLNMCMAGDIKADVKLNKVAGIPGENLLVNAEVTNWSAREISLIQATLVMTSTYYARGSQIVFNQIISKRNDTFDVPQLKGRRWRRVKMAVPPYIPDSGLEFCKIMDVDYTFQFRVVLGGKNGHDLIIETPITVGGHPVGYAPESDAWSRLSFPLYAGNQSLTESVDGDLFDLR
ncbi:arrestin domain-containing protein 3-like [Gigantopelta aegis]|uniref:arrestin domain-containing protein 3-like n=1 Tax=Gigantopelta aegis TaxID=1735272 RepID=UPI001B88C2AC|nr:arrestin domain-containing protein 3-like [Gigantopelta aegis]